MIQNALLYGKGGLMIPQKGMCLDFENPVSETNRPDTARREGSSGLGRFL